jgi:hypothetical protein
MRTILFLITFIVSGNVFANLYLTTEYQEDGKAPVVTKHHIFLNKRYPVNYWKMAYSLTLTKIGTNGGTIETETFVINKKGNKEFSAGGIANFTLGKPLKLEQFSRSGKREFILKVFPEKIIP